MKFLFILPVLLFFVASPFHEQRPKSVQGFAFRPLNSHRAKSVTNADGRSCRLNAVKLLDDEAVEENRRSSFVLSKDEVKPLFTVGKDGKEKVVNAFGLWAFAVSLLTGTIWAAALTVVGKIDDLSEGKFDPDRELYDRVGKIWSKAWLSMSNSFPTFSGDIESLQSSHGQPCLYVANHASWIDIPLVCTVLDPAFKFIAKSDLGKVPCVGQQLVGVSVYIYCESNYGS